MIAKHKLLSHNFYRQQMNRTTGEATAEQKKRLTRLHRRTSQNNYLKVVWNTSDIAIHLDIQKQFDNNGFLLLFDCFVVCLWDWPLNHQ